jgi:hypothetical protein
MWLAPIATVENLQTALALACNHRLGMAITKLDFDAPARLRRQACEELSSLYPSRIAAPGSMRGRRS